MSFVHLHVHSNFSILDGMSRLSDLIDRALQYNMPGIALTDHGSMYGVKEFLDYDKKTKRKAKAAYDKALEKLQTKNATEEEQQANEKRLKQAEEHYNKAKNFMPIVGCEVYCAARSLFDKDKNKKIFNEKRNREIIVDLSGYHLIILAKNKIGYQNLCKLVSTAWIDGFYQKPRIDKNILEKYSEGLIVASACLGGEIPQLIMSDQIEEAKKQVLWFKKIFDNDYYLEIQLHKPTRVDVSNEVYLTQLTVNKKIFEIAQLTDTKVIATNDIHFVDADHADAHERLVCLSTGKKISDKGRLEYTKEEYLKTADQMKEIFSDHPEVISNTLEILSKIERYSLDSPPIMPRFDIPESFGTLQTYSEKFSEHSLVEEFAKAPDGSVLDNSKKEQKIEELGGVEQLAKIKLEADYLEFLTYKGAENRYGEITEEIKDRIDFELTTIKLMGYPGYFLIVQDFVQAARDMGVWVGPGRGSAAGSVVAYCLKITNLDPFKYDLLFERFLNPDRISLPDIDIDFDNDGLPKVLDWVSNKYGKDSVAHIINYGTMATKLAITDVGRVQEVPLGVVNDFKKLIPDHFEEHIKDSKGNRPSMNIENVVKYVGEVKKAIAQDKNLAEMMHYAQQLEGTVRQTGVHACGIIIAPNNLTNYVPLSTAEDKNKEKGKKEDNKVLVTQYDGSVVESIGLIKMDFLALKTLSILKEAVANIKKSKNIEIDIDAIPLDDATTFDLYCKGQTVGVFQFESPGMRKYLKELKPSTIDDLIAMNALYRPGPMSYIPDFIDRKHGKNKIVYDIDDMCEILEKTYGITVYQEQVMLLSRKLANFTRGQSDRLRKAMGKKQKDILAEMNPKFIAGGKKNGYPEQKLKKIWSDWEKFAEYAFNKSHSACYSILSFQTAYLKANHTAEYMAAILTLNKDKIVEVNKFMEECKALGLSVVLPDINESDATFTVNKNGKIRFGLSGIKNVGDAAVESIVEERTKNGHYKSLFDFLERVNLKSCNKKTIESLVLSGALDCFVELKREDYFYEDEKGTNIDRLIEWGKKAQHAKEQSVNSLFGDTCDMQIPKPVIVKAEQWNDLVRLNYEKELIGMYVSAHPLDPYKNVIVYGCSNSIAEVNKMQERIKGKLDKVSDLEFINFDLSQLKENFTIGGIITKAEELISKNNKRYGRFSIEDYSDKGNFSLFGPSFNNLRNYLVNDKFVYITGEIVAEVRRDRQTNKNVRNVNVNILSIVDLDTLSDDIIKTLKIDLLLSHLDQPTEEILSSTIKNNYGNVDLQIRVVDSELDCEIALTPCNYGVSINSELMETMEELANNKKIGFSINGRKYETKDQEYVAEEETFDTP